MFYIQYKNKLLRNERIPHFRLFLLFWWAMWVNHSFRINQMSDVSELLRSLTKKQAIPSEIKWANSQPCLPPSILLFINLLLCLTFLGIFIYSTSALLCLVEGTVHGLCPVMVDQCLQHCCIWWMVHGLCPAMVGQCLLLCCTHLLLDNPALI